MTFESTLRELTTVGASLMPSSARNGCLEVGDGAWARFAAHWGELAPDCYAAELGTQRLRRYAISRTTPPLVPPGCSCTTHLFSLKTPTRSTSAPIVVSSH